MMLLMAFLELNVMVVLALGLSVLELYLKTKIKLPQNIVEALFQSLSVMFFVFLKNSVALFCLEAVMVFTKLLGGKKQFSIVVLATMALIIAFGEFVLTGQFIVFVLVAFNCYYSGMTALLRPILQKALVKQFGLSLYQQM
jgi:hypothetical protein